MYPIQEKFQIVVLDRGFVYIGHTSITGEMCTIRSARCIRRWGTTGGLAQLANGGPTPDTKLDGTINIAAPMRAVIHLIDAEEKRWK